MNVTFQTLPPAARRLCVLGLVVWLCGATRVVAQGDPQTSLYWAVPTAYNPAAAGTDTTMRIAGYNRMQWVGVDGAPRTFLVELDIPLRLAGRTHGVGLVGMNDKAGLFTTMTIGAQYAYRTALLGGRLSVGLQGGVVNQTFAGGDIYIPDGDAWEAADDALPRGDVSAMGFDAAAGLYYERGWWWGGVGATHLTATELELDEYAYSKQKRTYYFHAGGNIPVRRTLFIVQPSVLVKTTLQATQTDYTLRVTYDRRLWGGVSVRPGDAVVMMAGIDMMSVTLGYAYDIGTSALAKVAHGSHEIMAAYRLNLDAGKRRTRPSKSIRIL